MFVLSLSLVLGRPLRLALDLALGLECMFDLVLCRLSLFWGLVLVLFWS